MAERQTHLELGPTDAALFADQRTWRERKDCERSERSSLAQMECSVTSARTEVATGCDRSSTSLEAMANVRLLLHLVANTAQASSADGTLDEVAGIGCRRLAGRHRAERGRSREEGLRR